MLNKTTQWCSTSHSDRTYLIKPFNRYLEGYGVIKQDLILFWEFGENCNSSAVLTLSTFILNNIARNFRCLGSWFSFFDFFQFPEFDPGNENLHETVGDLHGLFANLLLALASFHALAGIWHLKIKRDGVFQRMWPKG